MLESFISMIQIIMPVSYTHLAVDKKYVEPVTRNDLLGGLHLVPDTEWQKQVLLSIQTIVTDYEGHLPGFELAICQTLLQIWNTLYTNCLLYTSRCV